MNDKIEEFPEDYVDEIGGFHSPGDCYNPNNVWCGECGKLTCKGCEFAEAKTEEELRG